MSNFTYMENMDFTMAYSKISCVSGVYPVHIATAYTLVVTGILALISRLIPRLVPLHVWFGRVFMLVMYWCMGSSLLIFTTGLPFAIIVFFLFMLVSLTIGWIAIKLHSEQLEKQAMAQADSVLLTMKSMGNVSPNIADLVQQEKSKIVNGKTFMQRLFSWKALHGLAMAFAWYQMFGRTVVTNPFPFRGCYTYPAYKSTTGEAVFIPEHDPKGGFDGREGQFIAMVSIPTILVFACIGIAFSWWGGRKAQTGNNKV